MCSNSPAFSAFSAGISRYEPRTKTHLSRIPTQGTATLSRSIFVNIPGLGTTDRIVFDVVLVDGKFDLLYRVLALFWLGGFVALLYTL